MSEIDELFKKQLLQEAKSPYHFEKKESTNEKIRAHNPICGDSFNLYFEEGSIYFHGFGCILSKASTSLMIRELEGKSISEAQRVVHNFLEAIYEKKEIRSEALRVFQKTDNFKGRIDCIVLSWKAMKKKLEEDEN